MKSDRQAMMERVHKRLKKDPPRMARVQVQWHVAAEIIAGHLTHSKTKWKNYEAHMVMNNGRAGIFEAIETGVPDRALWIYGVHAAGFPAAPHPKSAKLK